MRKLYNMWRAFKVKRRTAIDWNKPNGYCSKCGAPLNEYLVGGYKLHDNQNNK